MLQFFVACFTVPLRPSDLVRVKTDSSTKEALRTRDSVQLFIAIVFIWCSILDNVIVVKCMKKTWLNCYISSYHLTWLVLPNTPHKRYLIQSTSWFNFDLFCRTSRKQLCISSRINMQSDCYCAYYLKCEIVSSRPALWTKTNKATF